MAELVLLQSHIGDWDALRTAPSLPLALLHAASLAEKEFSACLIDQRTDPNWRAALKKAIGPETLAVCFTSLTGAMILHNLEMAAEVRKLTNALQIWGGVHPTMEPESTIAHSLVDVVVRGDGEQALLEIMRAVKNNRPLDGIKGVWHKRNGEIIRNPNRDPLDLDSLPEIPYHLIDVQLYMPIYLGRKCFFLQSSRGCQYACTFCHNTSINKGLFRAMSAEKTLQRVQYVKEKFGAEDIYFVDLNFFVELERSRVILEGLKKIGVTWHVGGVDIIALKHMDDDFLNLLEETGCRRLTVGIESGNRRVRKLMAKAGTLEDIETVVTRLKRHNILLYASFISGTPTETIDELKDTTNFALKLLKINPNLRTSPIYNYTPYPGTPMFKLAVENGYNPPETLEEWGKLGGWDVFTWVDRPGAHLHEALYFVSNFLDTKTREYEIKSIPHLAQFLIDCYRPVARWRVKNLNFNFLIEKRLAEYAQRILERNNPNKPPDMP